MRIFLPIFALILFTCSSIGAPFNQVIRTPLTTNEMMNQPQNSFIPIWNSAAAKWSNGVNTASATNNAQPPSTVLTNLSFTDAITNANGNQFGALRPFLTITNTPKITNLWDYITARIFGDLFVSTNLNVTNKITAYGLLGIESAGGGGFLATGGGLYSSSQFAGEKALQTSIGPTAGIEESAVTSQELGYLSGVAGPIQDGINNRIANNNGKGTNTDFYTTLELFGNALIGTNLFVTNSARVGSLTVVGASTLQGAVEVQGLGTGRRALFIDQNDIVQALADVDDTELGYLDGVTSGIQAQIDGLSSATDRIANLNGRGTNTTFLNITNIGAFTNVGNLGVGGNQFIFGDLGIGGNLNVSGIATLNALDVTSSLSSTSTNIIDQQSEDTTPASDDYVLVHDVSTASLTRVQLGNLPTSGASVAVSSNRVITGSQTASVTNALRRFYFETNVAQILSNLVAAATSGDVVELGVGKFNIGVQSIRVPVGVTLRGQGIDRTIISGTVGSPTNPIIQLHSTNTFEDFTVSAGNRAAYFQFPMANRFDWGAMPAATNVVLRRIKIDAETDGIYVEHTNYNSGFIEHCQMYAKYDVAVFQNNTNPAATFPGNEWLLKESIFVSDVKGATLAAAQSASSATPIRGGHGIVTLVNCTVIATNGNSYNNCLYGFLSTNIFRIFGGRYEAAGTNNVSIVTNIAIAGGKTFVDVTDTSITWSNTIPNANTFPSWNLYEVSHLSSGGVKLTGGQTANSVLGLNASTNVVPLTLSGLTFHTSGNVLSNSSAGSGGGGPGTLPMNSTQFDTNSPVSLISGFRGTNANLLNVTNRGVVHYSSGLASNSFLYLGANSNVAAGTFGSGLTFSGGTVTAAAASTNNPVQAIGTMILTNGTIYKPMDLGSTTNVVLSWNTNYYVVSPSNSPTISWTDIPASTDGRKIYLKLINTNFSSAFFPTNGLNGGSVILLSSPSTNEYTLNKDTNGFWIASGQILTTGRLDTNVFNVEPVIHSPTLTGTNTVNGNIGWVEQYPTGTGGALTNFTLLVNQAASFVINGFTNVSFRALYGGVAGLTYTFSIEITNGSGANRTLEFSQVTNNWVWAYGMAAPTVLTNSERIVIEGKLRGPSNITVTAAYFPWP